MGVQNASSHSESKKASKRLRNLQANSQGIFSLKVERKHLILGTMSFLGCLFFLNMVTSTHSHTFDKLPELDLEDSAKLKEVFLSGIPWVVYCYGSNSESSPSPEKLQQLMSFVPEVQFAKVNCWTPLESSSKTLARRFKLPNTEPLTITVANTMPPKVLKLKGTKEKIRKQILADIKPTAVPILSFKDWNVNCRSRKTCVVLASRKRFQRDVAEEAMRPLMEEYRAIRFASVDTSFWQVKLEEQLLTT